MPQSLAKVLIHVVFSTKHRTPWLKDRDTRKELHRYMMGTLQSLECWPSALDGVEDHVHFLCQLSRKIAIMDLIEEVKTSSSKWIKSKGASYCDFHWQAGYGVFSVSESMRPMMLVTLKLKRSITSDCPIKMSSARCAHGMGLRLTNATCGIDDRLEVHRAPVGLAVLMADIGPRPAAWAGAGRPFGPSRRGRPKGNCSAELAISLRLLRQRRGEEFRIRRKAAPE